MDQNQVISEIEANIEYWAEKDDLSPNLIEKYYGGVLTAWKLYLAIANTSNWRECIPIVEKYNVKMR